MPLSFPENLVLEAMHLARANTRSRAWSLQRTYGGSFPLQTRTLSPSIFSDMLRGDFWLASRAFLDAERVAYTDRLVFDLDAKRPEDRARAELAHEQLLRVVGVTEHPLVYGTPSGYGYRLVWRIPSRRLRVFATDRTSGPLVDYLRDRGIDVSLGRFEVFPNASTPDRLLFGKRMPLLDPANLDRLFAPCDDDDTLADPRRLAEVLRQVERLLAEPSLTWHSLIDDLCRKRTVLTTTSAPSRKAEAGKPLMHLTATCTTSAAITSSDAELPAAIPSSHVAWVERGLTAPSTRFDAFFAVLCALVSAPTRWPEFALSTLPTDDELASALASWLARRHNGYSADWRRSVARRGVNGAIEWWRRQVLARDRKGDSMVDRARRTAWSRRNVRPVPMPGLQHHELVCAIAERQGFLRAARYRFELWALSLITHAFTVGAPVASDTPTRQMSYVRSVGLQAQLLQRLPYGKGTASSGNSSESSQRTAYAAFMEILVAEGVLFLKREHRRPLRSDFAGTGLVREYIVRLPSGPASALELTTAAASSRRGVCNEVLDHLRMLHAGWALPHAEEYGRRTAERLHRIVLPVAAAGAAPSASDGAVSSSPSAAPAIGHMGIPRTIAVRTWRSAPPRLVEHCIGDGQAHSVSSGS